MEKLQREPTAAAVMTAEHPATKTTKHPGEGLSVPLVFCPDDRTDPFATVDWELRTAAIKGEGGEVVFEQHDCEIPASWTQLATNVVAAKYFYGEVGTGEREKGVRQLIHRVARTIADWGMADGYFAAKADGERFYRELCWLLPPPVRLVQLAGLVQRRPVPPVRHQGGDVQLALGPDDRRGRTSRENPYEYPQASACFIQSVADNMEDIMELGPQRGHALQVRLGHGHGHFHAPLAPREALRRRPALRPALLHAGLRPDRGRGQVGRQDPPGRQNAVHQGLAPRRDGVHRVQEPRGEEGPHPGRAGLRPAGSLRHGALPERQPLGPPERRVHAAAVETDRPWTTHWVTKPEVAGPSYPAREMFNKIAASTWCCGDPGVQYDTTINHWHTCPNSGRINASNPCSEYMFVDDSACNLASINLMKFRREDGTFDHERFLAACRLVFIAQEILVDHGSYPTKRIAGNSHRFRPIGLGYSNLGSLIMTAGLAYDSDEARGLCGAVTALLHGGRLPRPAPSWPPPSGRSTSTRRTASRCSA